MLIGSSITLPFYLQNRSAAEKQANSHYARVIDDGGVIDSYYDLVLAIQGLMDAYGSPDLSTYLAAVIDPAIFGYNIGTGSGTTLGRAAQKLYSLMGASSDVVQNTVAAQPLLLRWNSTDGNYFVPESGDATTPDTVANRTFDDFEIITYADFRFNTTGGIFNALTKEQGTVFTNGYTFGGIASGLRLLLGNGVVNDYSASVTFTGPTWYRVTRNATTGEIVFYQSHDARDTDVDSISWTTLSTQTGITGTLTSNTAPVRVGYQAFLGNRVYKVYRALIRNAVSSGTTILDFNANDYNISTSQNTLTSSSTGEVWTINRSTAATGYKAQLVYRTTTQFDGIDDDLKTAGVVLYSGTLKNSEYMTFDLLNLTAGQRVKDGFVINTGEFIKSATGYSLNGPVNATKVANRMTSDIIRFDNTAGQAYIKVNGTTPFTGVTSQIPQGLTIAKNGSGAGAGNFIFNSHIAPKQQDSTSIELAVNALMKTWSNNPI